MYVEPWSAWTFAITVALAVLVAGWTARVRPEPRPTLPLAHVAAAALLGTLGWEALNMLPGTITGLFLATTGIPEARGAEANQAFAAASPTLSATPIWTLMLLSSLLASDVCTFSDVCILGSPEGC